MEVEAGTHIEYLAGQDITHSKAFWKKSLQGFTVPTPLTVARTILKNELITEYQEQTINLPKTLVSALELLARLHNLTINTLLHGGWALLLSRYSCESDVVFGIQLTSANCGLESIASFGHPLPMRIQVTPDTPLLSWLKELQTQLKTLQAYKHTPLAKVQEWSDIPIGTPLFESLLVLSDAPIATEAKDQGSQEMHVEWNKLRWIIPEINAFTN